MTTPIKRKRNPDNINGMSPPADPVSAFKKSGRDRLEQFKKAGKERVKAHDQGVKDKLAAHKSSLDEKQSNPAAMSQRYMRSVNAAMDDTQRNVRQLKTLHDAIEARVTDLEATGNEPLPEIPYVPELIAGKDIAITKTGRDLKISSIAAPLVEKPDALPTWKYDATVAAAADPGANKFRLDNATIASATEMYINDSALNSLDISGLLGDVTADSHVYIQNVGRSVEALSLKVTSVTDNTGWFTIVFTVDAIASETTWTDLGTFGFLLPLSAGGTGILPAKFSSDSALTVSVYANGFSQAATETGLTLNDVCNVAAGQYFPIGTELFVLAAGTERIGLVNGVW